MKKEPRKRPANEEVVKMAGASGLHEVAIFGKRKKKGTNKKKKSVGGRVFAFKQKDKIGETLRGRIKGGVPKRKKKKKEESISGGSGGPDCLGLVFTRREQSGNVV